MDTDGARNFILDSCYSFYDLYLEDCKQLILEIPSWNSDSNLLRVFGELCSSIEEHDSWDNMSDDRVQDEIQDFEKNYLNKLKKISKLDKLSKREFEYAYNRFGITVKHLKNKLKKSYRKTYHLS